MSTDTPGEFQIYPRGFLGKPLGPHVEKQRRPFYDRQNGLQYDLDLFEQKTPQLRFNVEVEKLFTQYIRNEIVTDRNKFREKILLAAFDAFGTRDFYSWYRVQSFSPFFSTTHKDFLEDTIHFLVTGRRKLGLESWSALLAMGEQGDTVDMSANEMVSTYFGLDAMGRAMPNRHENHKLVDVIQRWCSQPGGINDLAFTLNILFGKF